MTPAISGRQALLLAAHCPLPTAHFFHSSPLWCGHPACDPTGEGIAVAEKNGEGR